MKNFVIPLCLCIILLPGHASSPFDLGQEAPAHSCQAVPTDSPVAKVAEQPGQEELAKKLLAALAGQDLSAYSSLVFESLPAGTLKSIMLEIKSPPLTEEYVKHTAKLRGLSETQARERIMKKRQQEKSRLDNLMVEYDEEMKKMASKRKSEFEQLFFDVSREAGIDWKKVDFVKMDGEVFQWGEGVGSNFDLVFSHGSSIFKLLLQNCVFTKTHGWLMTHNPRWGGAYVSLLKNLEGVRLDLMHFDRSTGGEANGTVDGGPNYSNRYQVSFTEKADGYSLAEWMDGAWQPVQKGKTEIRRRTVSLVPNGTGDPISLSFSEDRLEKGQMIRFLKHLGPIGFVWGWKHDVAEITEIVRGTNQNLVNPRPVPNAGKPTSVQLTQQEVFGGKFKEVRNKLEHGADPDFILLPKGKKTALHCCCMGGRVNLVKLLLAKGANPNALDNSKMTPLDVLFSPDFKGRLPLERMAAEKQLEIKTMLEKAGGKRNRP